MPRLRQLVRATATRLARYRGFGERWGYGLGWLIVRCGRRAPALLRRSAMFVAIIGNVPLSRGLVRGAAGKHDPASLPVVHALAVGQGQAELADAIERRIERVAGAEEVDGCRAARLTASGQPVAAIELLRRTPGGEARHTGGLTAALYAAGQFAELDHLLREHGDRLPASERALRQFETRCALGDAAGAWDGIDLSSPELIRQPGLLAALIDADPEVRDQLVDTCRQLSRSGAMSYVDDAVGALFRLGMLDEVLEHDARRLGPTGRHAIAAAHYVRRDFSAARRVLSAATGTIRHWDAEKLEARMRLEEGDFSGALEARRGRERIPPAFDEVRYYAQLHLGAFEEAFTSNVDPVDLLALAAAFGERAERRITGRPRHRFVIAQDGPGDELLTASGYSDLAATCERLTITCDPRLASLLRRSFPAIEFVPVTRLRRRGGLGYAGPAAAQRAGGSLFRLLTVEAEAIATTSDRVALGRTVLGWSLPAAGGRKSYLVAEPELVDRFTPRCAGMVGLAWRSELMDPMRRIHYVTAGDLAPLAHLDASFVCLQYDVTADERAVLASLFGDRISWLDDIDLRNDFDAAAAVVSSCSAVVGTSTTMTELAAAVGTATAALHPTTWATWRRQPDGSDAWHAAMRLAGADPYSAPARCVANAVGLVRSALHDRAP